MATEISNFIEDHTYLDFPDISKQAFSKARQSISPKAFKELCRLFVDSFYNSANNLKKWNGISSDFTVYSIRDSKFIVNF